MGVELRCMRSRGRTLLLERRGAWCQCQLEASRLLRQLHVESMVKLCKPVED